MVCACVCVSVCAFVGLQQLFVCDPAEISVYENLCLFLIVCVSLCGFDPAVCVASLPRCLLSLRVA